MEHKQGIHINDNYTNFTSLSEFRVDVKAEMAEVDRLLDGLGSSFSKPSKPHTPDFGGQQNANYIEVNDNYTNFNSLSEYRVDIAAEMEEVDKFFGDDVPAINNFSGQMNSHVPNTAYGTSNNHQSTSDDHSLHTQMQALQIEVQMLNDRFERIEKLLNLLVSARK